MDNETVLVVCRGLQGSGKSTLAKAWVAENPDLRIRVNRDDSRFEAYGKYVLDNSGQEYILTIGYKAKIKALLNAGISVVVDDTNLRASNVKELLKIAVDEGAEVAYMDVETPLEDCIARNAVRASEGGRNVPEEVIRSFASRYLKKGRLPEQPSLEVVEAEKIRQYEPDESLPPAYLLDVDGTAMLNLSGRGFFDWSRVSEDTPNLPVVEVAQRLAASGADIVVVSGRSDICLEDTMNSLENAGVPFDAVFMRKDGDSRKDSTIKEEIFFRDIASRWNVRGALDDRDQVVDQYRAMGLLVMQVAPGNF